ncbi:MAG: hypothetical protein ACR2NF_01915 [Pirellulales bacterium]
MDNIFQWLMLLFVIITSVFRFIKGRKVKKTREQLAEVAPLINASVDPGRRSISGKIDDVPFKVKYEPELENTPARLDVILDKRLPFTLEVAARTTPFDHQQSLQSGEFLLEDSKFDENISVTTSNAEECREYLKDPLFQQGVEFVISQGYCIRFTRRRAVLATPDIAWLADPKQAASSLTNILQLGHSLIGEFE